MSLYLDAGVILKLYIQEPNSHEIDSIVTSYQQTLVLTPLQLLETHTALRAKLFRQEIDIALLKVALKGIDKDIKDGLWKIVYPEQMALYQKAGEISTKWGVTTGCRTLDLLHVAQAWMTHSKTLVSFDIRQRALAAKTGLKLLPT